MLVIKIGGGPGIDYDAIFRNVARLIASGRRLVVVHGANEEMRVISERLGKPPRMITSESGYESRYTDVETIEIFTMVYAGRVNKRLVAHCHRLGINAVGLCGVDGGLLTGDRKKAIRVVENGRRLVIRDDRSGSVESVNAPLLALLLDNGYMPLVCPPALSDEGEAMNVDGDRAAAMIAVALGAETLIILSNVPGLLRDRHDESTLIPSIERARMSSFEGFAEGRMRKKTLGAVEAIDRGVRHVILADARVADPIDAAIAGAGTHVR